MDQGILTPHQTDTQLRGISIAHIMWYVVGLVLFFLLVAIIMYEQARIAGLQSTVQQVQQADTQKDQTIDELKSTGLQETANPAPASPSASQ